MGSSIGSGSGEIGVAPSKGGLDGLEAFTGLDGGVLGIEERFFFTFVVRSSVLDSEV